MIPLAVTVGSLISVLTLGGLAWLAPLVAGAAAVALRDGWPLRGAVRAVAVVAAFMLAVAIPVLLVGGGVPSLSSDLANGTLGTLFRPLNVLQAAGIWPAGDFRVGPEAPVATYLAIVVAIAAGAYGLWWAWSGREWPLLFYGSSGGIGLATILAFGSPWVDAKALAIASPAILLPAAVGALKLIERGRRAEGLAAIAVLVAGVGWSNVLAYHGAKLAPRAQLAELETIGHRLAGEGPTLLTEFQPYGARHFLREADAESVSELRVRAIPQRGGRPVPLGESADTDALRFEDLRRYRTLVVRRSPSASRPPADYRLVRRGDYYEVWQRPPGRPARARHLPLGPADPSARGEIARASEPRCSDVLALARLAGPGGELVAGKGVQPVVVQGGSVAIRRPGRYGVWLLGSVMGQVTAYVDGTEIGRVRHRINRTGNYIELGTADLSRGNHRIRASFSGGDLHPGSGAQPTPAGPLVLGLSAAEGTRLIRVRSADARSLCRKPWDWIESRLR